MDPHLIRRLRKHLIDNIDGPLLAVSRFCTMQTSLSSCLVQTLNQPFGAACCCASDADGAAAMATEAAKAESTVRLMRFDVKIIRVRSPENPVPERRRPSHKPLSGIWSAVRSPVGEMRHLHDPLRRNLLQWAAADIQPFLAKFRLPFYFPRAPSRRL